MCESELSMQARAMGADAALLIAAVLPNNDLAYLLKSAAKLRLQILIEVHTVAGAPPLVLLLHCGRPQDLQILPRCPLSLVRVPSAAHQCFTEKVGHQQAMMSCATHYKQCGVRCFTASYDSAVRVVNSR